MDYAPEKQDSLSRIQNNKKKHIRIIRHFNNSGRAKLKDTARSFSQSFQKAARWMESSKKKNQQKNSEKRVAHRENERTRIYTRKYDKHRERGIEPVVLIDIRPPYPITPPLIEREREWGCTKVRVYIKDPPVRVIHVSAFANGKRASCSIADTRIYHCTRETHSPDVCIYIHTHMLPSFARSRLGCTGQLAFSCYTHIEIYAVHRYIYWMELG